MASTTPVWPGSSSAEPPATADELLALLPWGVLVLDAPGVVRRVNQQVAQWCGLAAENLLNQPLAAADLPPDLRAALLRPPAPGEIPPQEFWLPRTQQWLSLCRTLATAGQRWFFWENVTARKLAEAAQQRSSQLLLAVEEVARTGSYEVDLATGSLYFSAGMYRLFGEAPQAFVPTAAFIDARSHPADAAAVRQVLAEALQARQPYTYRRRIARADGEQRILEAHGEVHCDETGQPRQLRGLVQDITERVRAEQALHHSRELLQRTIDSSLDMVQVFEAVRDAEGAVVDFTWVLNNAAAERRYGNVIGQRLGQRNPGVVAEGIFDTFKQVLATGVPDQSERHYAHEQFEGWFFQSTVKLGDGVATTTQDITHRKRMEQEMLRLQDELTQQLTDKYHALFYSMSQGFAVLEMLFDEAGTQVVDFRYLEVNPIFARESGMPEGILGRAVRELMPDLESFWFELYGRVVLTGVAERVEHYVPQVGRWFDVHALRVGVPAARQVAVLFNDITARKRTEEQLHAAAAAETFRLQLADAIGLLSDPVAIEEAVTRTARRHFNADRCYYCEIAGGQVITRRDDAAAGLPSVAGAYPLASFALLQAVMKTGRPLRVRDVRHDATVEESLRQLCVQRQSIAYLNVPLLKHGRPVGVLCLVQSQPRDWTTAEVALATEVAERTWAAVERARAEEALRVSEQRLRALIAGLPGAAVFIVGADLRYQLAGGEALNTAKLTPADLLGRTVAEALPPAVVAQHEAYYRQALAGQSFSLEHAAHGHTYISRGVPVPGPAGSPEAVLVVSYDITARKQAEEALRASEARLAELNAGLEERVARRTQQLQASRDLLQSVVDTSLISLSVMEAVRDAAGAVQDFRLRLVNRELERETGRADLVGKLYAQEYPGIREVGIFDLAARALATGEPQSTEYYYAHEGFQKWFACQFVKLGDGVVATNLDITERKLAEQDRLRSLRLLEQAEAMAGLGGWDYDLATRELTWSAGLYRLVELPVGQPVQPGTLLDFVEATERLRAERVRELLTTGAAPIQETLHLRTGGQQKVVRIRSVVLPDEAGQPARVLGVTLDITELQRLEADNLRLRLGQQQALFEAVQAAQEAERRRMAEGLHNGIGQILYATKLRLDLLSSPPQAAAAAHEAARHEADHLLGEAIRQVRALSHELVPLVLEEFGLAAALRDIGQKMSTAQLLLHTHVGLDEEAAPLTPTLQMALYRMAQELAQNIAKHAHGATEASLELETTPGWVLLRAEDNGPGFAPAPAAGLGLRSIRDQVALLGGQVESGSLATGGAYVRIRLPLPAEPVKQSVSVAQ